MSRLFKTLRQEAASEMRTEKEAVEKNAALVPPAPPAKKTAPTGRTVQLDAPPAPDATPGPNPGPKTALLFAWKASGINPRLLTAYRPGTDPTNPNNLVTVNVRSNVNFLPHMRLRVSQVSETVFDFVGALPRWRGRY